MISVAGDPTKTPVIQGTDVGITKSFWLFNDPIGTMVVGIEISRKVDIRMWRLIRINERKKSVLY